MVVPMTHEKVFTDNFIINGAGHHDEIMRQDEFDILLYSGEEFSVKRETELVNLD